MWPLIQVKKLGGHLSWTKCRAPGYDDEFGIQDAGGDRRLDPNPSVAVFYSRARVSNFCCVHVVRIILVKFS